MLTDVQTAQHIFKMPQSDEMKKLSTQNVA
jgi:hypothetical protein